MIGSAPLAYPYSTYCGAPPNPADLWSRWNLDPVLIAALAAAFAVHAVATRGMSAASFGRRACFYFGWALGGLALVSPLCALSVSLFSARIAQHMVLETLVAPLVALGLPPSRGRGALPAGAAFAAALWIWHVPGPYVATFDSNWIYWAMHLSLFGAALWFWREALGARERAMAASVGATLAVSVAMALLGAVILLAPEPLYAPHVITARAWGLTPLADQQLGAVIMWVPAGLIFVISIMASLAALLRREAPASRMSPA